MTRPSNDSLIDLTVAIANIIYRGFNSETMGWSEALGKAKEIEELTMGDASARKDEDAAPLRGSTNSPVRCDIPVVEIHNEFESARKIREALYDAHTELYGYSDAGWSNKASHICDQLKQALALLNASTGEKPEQPDQCAEAFEAWAKATLDQEPGMLSYAWLWESFEAGWNARSPVREFSEWWPVSEAPMDVAVLTWGPGLEGNEIAHYNSKAGRWITCLNGSPIYPTHFMFIPENPTTEIEDQTETTRPGGGK